MRIGVGTLAIGDKFKQDVKYGHRSKVEYCKRHGYDLITDESVADGSLHPAWSKVHLILKYLSQYEYFVWIDADTVITNPDPSLEGFIHRMMGNKDLMYAKAYNWVNTGVMFIKNTPFMHDFFREVLKHTDQMCWEQGSVDLLWRTNWKGCRSKIVISPNRREYNSLWHQWRPHQFLVHFPSCGEPDRPKDCLRRMIELYYPSQMDGESDEDYQKRMEWQKQDIALLKRKCDGEGKYFPL